MRSAITSDVPAIRFCCWRKLRAAARVEHMLHVAPKVSTKLGPSIDQTDDEVLASRALSCSPSESILLQHLDTFYSSIFVDEHIICYASLVK